MTTVAIDTLGSVLRLEFALGCSELTEARDRQRRKDTPAHRASVVGVLERIDGVLDMYLQSQERAADRPADLRPRPARHT